MNFDPRRMSEKIIDVCPVCNAQQSFNVQLVSQESARLCAYLSCKTCNARLFARIDFFGGGIVGNAVVTDLSFEEVLKIYHDISNNMVDRGISSNDVIDVVNYFNNSHNHLLLQKIYG
jgi:hypothetical protein